MEESIIANYHIGDWNEYIMGDMEAISNPCDRPAKEHLRH